MDTGEWSRPVVCALCLRLVRATCFVSASPLPAALAAALSPIHASISRFWLAVWPATLRFHWLACWSTAPYPRLDTQFINSLWQRKIVRPGPQSNQIAQPASFCSCLPLLLRPFLLPSRSSSSFSFSSPYHHKALIQPTPLRVNSHPFYSITPLQLARRILPFLSSFT